MRAAAYNSIFPLAALAPPRGTIGHIIIKERSAPPLAGTPALPSLLLPISPIPGAGSDPQWAFSFFDGLLAL